MADTKKTINDLTTATADVSEVNLMVQPTSTSNTLQKMAGTVISEKAKKVSGATANNFAKLDSNGDLADSGVAVSDYNNLKNAFEALGLSVVNGAINITYTA